MSTCCTIAVTVLADLIVKLAKVILVELQKGNDPVGDVLIHHRVAVVQVVAPGRKAADDLGGFGGIEFRRTVTNLGPTPGSFPAQYAARKMLLLYLTMSPAW